MITLSSPDRGARHGVEAITAVAPQAVGPVSPAGSACLPRVTPNLLAQHVSRCCSAHCPLTAACLFAQVEADVRYTMVDFQRAIGDAAGCSQYLTAEGYPAYLAAQAQWDSGPARRSAAGIRIGD